MRRTGTHLKWGEKVEKAVRLHLQRKHKHISVSRLCVQQPILMSSDHTKTEQSFKGVGIFIEKKGKQEKRTEMESYNSIDKPVL